MKKTLGFLAVATLIILCVYKYWVRPYYVVFATASPDSRYQVEVTQRGGLMELLLFQSTFSYRVRKDEGEWGGPTYMVGFDDRQTFSSRYTNVTWSGNSTLSLFDKRNPWEQCDVVQISNRSGKSLKDLMIRTDGLSLVFDLPPGAKTEVNVPHYPGALNWLEVHGSFEDGVAIKGKGADFDGPTSNKIQPAYCISVTDNDVLIQSATAEVWDSDPKIPSNPGCVTP